MPRRRKSGRGRQQENQIPPQLPFPVEDNAVPDRIDSVYQRVAAIEAFRSPAIPSASKTVPHEQQQLHNVHANTFRQIKEMVADIQAKLQQLDQLLDVPPRVAPSEGISQGVMMESSKISDNVLNDTTNALLSPKPARLRPTLRLASPTKVAPQELALKTPEEIQNLLFCAVEKDDIKAFRKLWRFSRSVPDLSSIDINARDKTSFQTLLHCAVRANSLRLVHEMLLLGAEPNFQDQSGQCPLHLAVSQGTIEMCQLLLRGSADPNAPDGNGHTPAELSSTLNRNYWLNPHPQSKSKKTPQDDETVSGEGRSKKRKGKEREMETKYAPLDEDDVQLERMLRRKILPHKEDRSRRVGSQEREILPLTSTMIADREQNHAADTKMEEEITNPKKNKRHRPTRFERFNSEDSTSWDTRLNGSKSHQPAKLDKSATCAYCSQTLSTGGRTHSLTAFSCPECNVPLCTKSYGWNAHLKATKSCFELWHVAGTMVKPAHFRRNNDQTPLCL